MTTIQGLMIPTSPLHIASPEEARWDWARNNYASTDRAPPITLTTTLRVVDQANPDDEGMLNTVKVPVIPANSLRGRLRRAALDVLGESLKKKGQKLSLDTWHVLSCGAATGRPDRGSSVDVRDILSAREHVYMGLFGGGPRMFRSQLRVDTAVQVCPVTLEARMVPSYYGEMAVEHWRTLQAVMFRHVDDALELANPLMGEVIRDFQPEVEKWREFLAVTGKAKKGADEDVLGTSPNALDRWSTMQVVIPGTAFFSRFDVLSDQPEHLGLTLLALERVLRKEGMGGWVRNGMGRIGVQQFSLHNGESVLSDVLVQREGGVALNRELEEINAVVGAAETAIESLDLDELETLCAPRDGGSWYDEDHRG